MNCSPFDLRDYVLAELGESESRSVELHASGCAACTEELERLRLTHAALLVLRDEEVPQRIAFVSDKVFEPSPWRRVWSFLWTSSARLAFGASAMLLVAAVVWNRPVTVATAPPAPVVDVAKLQADFDSRMRDEVAKAVAASEAREEKRHADFLKAMENRYEVDRQALHASLEQSLRVMEGRRGTLILASGGGAGEQR